jgi:long-chain fatty acid transport protein
MKQSGLKRINTGFIFSVALMFIFCFVSESSATNGYFAHGYSVKNKALAGVGTALPLDSLAASNNPAGMVFVGKRIDVGVSFFNPNRKYEVNGAPTTGLMPGVSCNFPGAPLVPGGPPCPFGLAPGEEESGSKWFVIPSFGFNWMMNNNYSLGVSIYGNGGMNTDYDANTFNVNPMLPSFGDSPTGVDLAQLFVVPTYARKLNPKHAIGISPIIAYQTFEAQGLQAFGEAGFSQDPSKLTDNGHNNSYGLGGRFGYLGEILPDLFFGASYQTKIYMQKFDDYAGLFAEDGDFDIPANWSAGLAYHLPGPALIFAFDVQQIFYSDVDSIANDFTPFNTCFGSLLMGASASSTSECLGGDQGVGFGWDDMTVYKFGIQWESSPAWTWRAGYSYGEQPIPDSEVLFNIIAPGVIEQHITAGFTFKTKSNQELNFALMRALSNTIEGPNPLDPAQTIELQMDQWEITAGYSWTF